jgi:hypothetical protein
MPTLQKVGYFRRRGWKDLIFVIVVLCVWTGVWFGLRYWLNPDMRLSDRQKWGSTS